MLKLIIGGLLLVGLAIALGSRVLAATFMLLGAGIILTLAYLAVTTDATATDVVGIVIVLVVTLAVIGLVRGIGHVLGR